MNQPKPKQIRLPFSVPKPGRSKGQQRTCGICRRTEGKYTCPRCNLVYCSLACFQDPSHAQWSEPFYKATVMDQIATDPQVGVDDKKDMIDMLRRFEQQAEGEMNGSLGPDGDDIEEEDELEERLRGIDLEDIDTNKLFHLLPQQHRDAFLAAIREPDSEAGQQLLATLNEGGSVDDGREDTMPTALPWWESQDGLNVLEDEDLKDKTAYAPEPEAIDEASFAAVIPPAGVGQKLVFNALAVCVAYIHVLLAFRLPSLVACYLKDSTFDADDVKRELANLIPFLTDQKSTVRHESVRLAYSSVWERIGSHVDPEMKPDQNVLRRLLDITRNLVHPPITTDPPRIHLVLSDLYHLFAQPKIGHVAKKLLFYTASLKQLARADWLHLEQTLEKEIERLEQEVNTDDTNEAERPERSALLL